MSHLPQVIPHPAKNRPIAFFQWGAFYPEIRSDWRINRGSLSVQSNRWEIPYNLVYQVVRRELGSVWGSHIPYIFPIQWGAKELLRASQPSNSSGAYDVGRLSYEGLIFKCDVWRAEGMLRWRVGHSQVNTAKLLGKLTKTSWWSQMWRWIKKRTWLHPCRS